MTYLPTAKWPENYLTEERIEYLLDRQAQHIVEGRKQDPDIFMFGKGYAWRDNKWVKNESF